jgi:hypothetical protein
MKRWLFAVGTLLLGAVTSAQADYVLIVYDLGVPKNQGNQQPGMAGMPGMMGMPGMKGRQGPDGMGPGGMGPGGQEGPAGMQEMMRRMGQGMRPGGQGGGPGGFPGAGGRGMPGGPGGGRMGGMGPGMGGRNQGLFPGFGGQSNPNLLNEDEDDSTTIKVSAVIEVKAWKPMTFPANAGGAGGNPGGFGGLRGAPGGGFGGLRGAYGGNVGKDTFEAFTHNLVKGGWTGLYDAGDIHYQKIDLKTVDQRYKARRDAILKGSDKNAANYQDLAEWVLNNGKVDEFPRIMEDWEKVDADSAPVTAFKKVKAEINRQISKDDPGLLAWQNRLGDYRVKLDPEKYPHYALLYSSAKNAADTSDVNNRMKRLEDNYKAFFYWFTLKGKALPVPDYRLVAVLIDKPSEFEIYHKIFDNVPLSDDGFYARRENLAFFSATPLDEVYDTLDASMKDLWGGKGWYRDKLLQGGGAPRGSNADAVEVIRNQVKVLLLKALQDESELTTATHEGTLQLASVTGLLPRTVSVPEWAQFGLGSFFETSKGAWWPGTGAPNHHYLKQFKKLQDKKALDTPAEKALQDKKLVDTSAETALKKVITDQYFREAHSRNQPADWTKARTMAWSLNYFLVQNRFEGLMNYYQELTNLPRDMEFDEEILLGCFVRAFKLDNPDNPGVAKPDEMQKLAQRWYDFMPTVLDEYGQYRENAEKVPETRKKSRTGGKKGQ